MQDELTALGRARWQSLADEAARERRARTVAPLQRATTRERLAAALVALADRLAPTTAPAAAAGELSGQAQGG